MICAGEGEYVVPASTVFGLTRAEVVSLKEAAGSGLTVTDSDTRNEGYEVRKDLKRHQKNTIDTV